VLHTTKIETIILLIAKKMRNEKGSVNTEPFSKNIMLNSI